MNCYLHVQGTCVIALVCLFLIFLAADRGLTMFMFSKLVSKWWKWQGNMELKALLASEIFMKYTRIYAWIFVLQVMLYVFLPSRSCRVLISQKEVPQITRYSTDWKHCVCMLSGAVIICIYRVAAGFSPWQVNAPTEFAPTPTQLEITRLKNLSFSYREKKTALCAWWDKTTQNMFISRSLIHWRWLANSK